MKIIWMFVFGVCWWGFFEALQVAKLFENTFIYITLPAFIVIGAILFCANIAMLREA